MKVKGNGSDADKKKWDDDYADWLKRRDKYQDDFKKNETAKEKLEAAIKKFNANKDPAWRARNRGPLQKAIDKYRAEKKRLEGEKPKLVAEKKTLVARKKRAWPDPERSRPLDGRRPIVEQPADPVGSVGRWRRACLDQHALRLSGGESPRIN